MIGFGVTSDWMTKWREFCKPIVSKNLSVNKRPVHGANQNQMQKPVTCNAWAGKVAQTR